MSDSESPSVLEPERSPSSPSPNGVAPAVRWTIRGAAAVALAGSVVLAYQSMGQAALPGCGPESGCQTVLNDEDWSHWLGLPVALPAAGLYAILLAATMFIGPDRPIEQRRLGWAVLWIGSIAAIGAAVWFTALQVNPIGEFCRYCTFVHVTGGLMAVLVFVSAPRANLSDSPPSVTDADDDVTGGADATASADAARPRPVKGLNFGVLTLLGMVPLAALGLGQFAVPSGDLVVWTVGQQDGADDPFHGPPSAPSADAAVAPEGYATAFGGQLRFRIGDVPSLGPDDAEVWMVYLFDYTCGHCRHMKPQLNAALERYDGQLGIIPLPAPLDASCNPMMRQTRPAAEGACELATLALAVWRADPSQFAAFDAWIYEPDAPPSPDAARAHAIELVGETALQAALDSGWPSDFLRDSINVFAAVGQATDRSAIPTLIVNQAVFGPTPEAAVLFNALEEHTPITAPAAPTQPPQQP